LYSGKELKLKATRRAGILSRKLPVTGQFLFAATLYDRLYRKACSIHICHFREEEKYYFISQNATLTEISQYFFNTNNRFLHLIPGNHENYPATTE
jgi:hypothetical protein